MLRIDTSYYTDSGIGELVIHFTFAAWLHCVLFVAMINFISLMDPQCIILAAMFTLSMGMPTLGYEL